MNDYVQLDYFKELAQKAYHENEFVDGIGQQKATSVFDAMGDNVEVDF